MPKISPIGAINSKVLTKLVATEIWPRGALHPPDDSSGSGVSTIRATTTAVAVAVGTGVAVGGTGLGVAVGGTAVAVMKIFSITGLKFTGSGFHSTDYGKSGPKKGVNARDS